MLYGPDRKPLPGTWAVLHHVQNMRGASGPVDSARTGPQGDYRLRIPRADTTGMYVVSSLYRGIAYFSEPVPIRDALSATLKPIFVYDTTSTGPPILTQRRLVTVALPSKDGTRAVLELLVLQNSGTMTRVAADTLRPTWWGLVPREAIQFQAEEGDISPQAVGLREDTVAVFGPIPPDEYKQLSYSYVLPSTSQRFAIPIGQPVGGDRHPARRHGGDRAGPRHRDAGRAGDRAAPLCGLQDRFAAARGRGHRHLCASPVQRADAAALPHCARRVGARGRAGGRASQTAISHQQSAIST